MPQGKIYERYKKEADALNAKVDEILEERNHIKELQVFPSLRSLGCAHLPTQHRVI